MIPEHLIPSKGGNGGSFGKRMRPNSFPPATEQMKSVTMPKRFPPGRHSFSVMDHTTPKSTAAMITAHTKNHSYHSNKLDINVDKMISDMILDSSPLVIMLASRPLGGQGHNLRSQGHHSYGGSVLVHASTEDTSRGTYIVSSVKLGLGLSERLPTTKTV